MTVFSFPRGGFCLGVGRVGIALPDFSFLASSSRAGLGGNLVVFLLGTGRRRHGHCSSPAARCWWPSSPPSAGAQGALLCPGQQESGVKPGRGFQKEVKREVVVSLFLQIVMLQAVSAVRKLVGVRAVSVCGAQSPLPTVSPTPFPGATCTEQMFTDAV